MKEIYYDKELEVLRLYKNMEKCLYVKWQKLHDNINLDRTKET